MAVLRPIAKERLACPERLARVWCPKRESWGFYSEDVSEEDAFLLWCSIVPGDMMLFIDEQCLVVFASREVSKNVMVWRYKLLASAGNTFDVEVEERELFRVAKRYL